MLSVRSLVRSAPRTARAFSNQTIRTSIKTPCGIPRQAATNPASWTRMQYTRGLAAFSTSVERAEPEGQVNAELAGKLAQELALEKEMRDPDTIPEHLKEFLDNTPFQLQDTPGSEEIVMTRAFGDEKIKVTFSVDDLNNVDEDPDQMQDHGMEDEFDDPSDLPTEAQANGGNTKASINQGRTAGGNFKVAPEDSIESSENVQNEEGIEHDNEPSFPAHLLVTVERANKGSLQIEAIAQDGLIVIDNIYFYKDASLADPKTAEQERTAARAYTGPPYGNLDEDLQILFENYLSERGINTTMALFVPEYIDYKEQREYTQWLSNVQNFVE
ncbi:hypothetical protein FH972_026226 [Carpinus fangiana]|uniref:Mitochondrial glycoprotein domain-containing protein n=1 Tax=Carpinus fangiana TaxID=176857 RepID=A0A5N6L3C9_9ROSI|nr:hypothetical protein FH972_026226 [Carpinus fangiana]